MNQFSINHVKPEIKSDVFIAPGAMVMGKVSLDKGSSLWFNSVLRGDNELISVGEETNIQDLSMGHTDPGFPLSLGKRVTVGHNCILHGCLIEDDCLIGMGSIIMNGCQIGKGSIIGAGSVLLEGQVIPPFSLVVGSPAKVKKTYDDTILINIRRSASVYAERAAQYLKELERI